MATDELKRRILEVMALSECRLYFADGSVVRLTVRLDISEGAPKYVFAEGLVREGDPVRAEWYSADGRLAFTSYVKDGRVLSGHPGFGAWRQTGAV